MMNAKLSLHRFWSLLLVQVNCELLKVTEQNENSYGDQTIVPEAEPFWVNANFDEEHLDSSHVVAKSLVGYNFLKKNWGYRSGLKLK